MQSLREVCLEITGSCPLQCIHCSSVGKRYRKRRLKWEAVELILADLKRVGTSILEISGGEPVTYPYLLQTISLAKEHGFEVRLYTSGVRVTGSNTIEALGEKTLKALWNCGLDRVIFNLQGASARTYEKITRTRGSFHAVRNSIAAAKGLGMWVGVHFVPMRINYLEIPAVVGLCSRLRVNEVALLRLVIQGRAAEHRAGIELTNEDYQRLFKVVGELRKNPRGDTRIRTGCPMNFTSLLVEEGQEVVSCAAGSATCTVMPNGEVVPCPAFKHDDQYIMGNVFTEPLSAIWARSSIVRSFREFNYASLGGACSGCQYLARCRGRCAAQRLHYWGDVLEGPDPACPLAGSSLARREAASCQAGYGRAAAG